MTTSLNHIVKRVGIILALAFALVGAVTALQLAQPGVMGVQSAAAAPGDIWGDPYGPSVPIDGSQGATGGNSDYTPKPAPAPDKSRPETGASSSTGDPWSRCQNITSRESAEQGYRDYTCTRIQNAAHYLGSPLPPIFGGKGGGVTVSDVITRAYCGADGDGRELLGVNITFEQDYGFTLGENGNGIPGRSWEGSVRATYGNCIWRTYVDVVQTQLCYVSGGISLDKTVPNQKHIGNVGAYTDWGRGNHTLEACAASKNIYVTMSDVLSEMGRYVLSPTIYADQITVRKYSAPPGVQTPPDKIVDIKRLGPRPGQRVYAQVVCDPDYSSAGTNRNAVYRGSWTWTWCDCLGTTLVPGDGTYMCVNDGPGALNGTATNGRATIFRDGEKNRISWNNPTITSPHLVKINSAKTQVSRTGTPWNTPKTLPAGNNNVTLKTPSGTNVLARGSAWMNGVVDDYDLTANWASDAGKPTVIDVRWRYDATWRVRGLRIDALELGTGKVYTTPIWTNVDSTADCTGRISLNVVRAVNDSNGG